MSPSSKKLLSYIGVPVLALILLLIFYSNLFSRWKGVDIYIPKGYSGPVVIFFDQKDGEILDQVLSRNIIRVPESGIYRAREGVWFADAPKRFFYAEGSSTLPDLEELPVSDTPVAEASSGVSCLSVQTLYANPGQQPSVATIFYVGASDEKSCESLDEIAKKAL